MNLIEQQVSDASFGVILPEAVNTFLYRIAFLRM